MANGKAAATEGKETTLSLAISGATVSMAADGSLIVRIPDPRAAAPVFIGKDTDKNGKAKVPAAYTVHTDEYLGVSVAHLAIPGASYKLVVNGAWIRVRESSARAVSPADAGKSALEMVRERR